MASKNKAASEEVVTAYKGFKQDLTCRGYQFEIGGTYKHEGEVEACASGFHSCEYPLDVFGYYAPGESRFAIVKASGQLSRHDADSKIASATLVVEAEISMPTMISRALQRGPDGKSNEGNSNEPDLNSGLRKRLQLRALWARPEARNPS
ncbi:DUF7666 domain-containing protein [Pseudomonas aeruginosa]